MPLNSDTEEQVAYLILGGAEKMHLLKDAVKVNYEEWSVLDKCLRKSPQKNIATDAAIADARLIIWVCGVGRDNIFKDKKGQRILIRALSCGLRTNTFELIVEQCNRLGFLESFGSVCHENPGVEIGLRLKYIRLLKRCGIYSDVLEILGSTSKSLKMNGGPEINLSVAYLLYGVAKSLGSYQNRSEQSKLLCDAIFKRILSSVGMTKKEFLSIKLNNEAPDIFWDAKQLWMRVADFQARQWVPRDNENRSTHEINCAAILRKWDIAIAIEDEFSRRAGRSRFARQAASFSLTSSIEDRHVALQGFERLLMILVTEDRAPDQRGIAIRSFQAAQMCLEMQLWGRARDHADLSLRAASAAADWQLMARALQLQATLVVSAQQGSAARWGEALYLMQRANEAMGNLREPPLPLLFDNCVGEARIALSMGNHAFAHERIRQAIGHVARMRDALLQEDWTGARLSSPEWLRAIAKLLTPRQRVTLQARLITDWQRLLRAQDALVELLGSAHELEYYQGIVSISASREKLVRSGLVHDISNVVSRRIAGLVVSSSLYNDGVKVIPTRDVAQVQQEIEDEIRHYMTGDHEMAFSVSSIPGHFFSIAKLVAIDQRQLKLLQTFSPELNFPVVNVLNDFFLRCDEKLFKILFFQFLLNAAQELVNSARPVIEVEVSWSADIAMGIIKIKDSAGRVDQLQKAIHRIKDEGRNYSRGWGMREAIRYFSEAWNCVPPKVYGSEGEFTVLQLNFPTGKNINKGPMYFI